MLKPRNQPEYKLVSYLRYVASEKREAVIRAKEAPANFHVNLLVLFGTFNEPNNTVNFACLAGSSDELFHLLEKRFVKLILAVERL
jgi:hypothetical protein